MIPILVNPAYLETEVDKHSQQPHQRPRRATHEDTSVGATKLSIDQPQDFYNGENDVFLYIAPELGVDPIYEIDSLLLALTIVFSVTSSQ